jgi:hypothetical protein
MLIIGGVAVQLSALPEWAQHLSAFFPGRYAVEAIQATVNGNGLNAVRFSLFALTIIGLAGCIAAAKMFRWDSRQRFASIEGKGWMGVALGAWVAVGALAEFGGQIPILRPEQAAAPQEASVTAPTRIPMPGGSAGQRNGDQRADGSPIFSPTPTGAEVEAAASPSPSTETRPAGAGSAEADTRAAQTEAVRGRGAAGATPASSRARGAGAAAAGGTQAGRSTAQSGGAGAETGERPQADAAGAQPAPAEAAGTQAAAAPDQPPSQPGEPEIGPPTWQQVTMAYIEADIAFERLPPDSGIVTPIASATDEPDPDTWVELDILAAALPNWAPGKVQDPVQRVRNLLYVAAVPDIFQIPMESFAPLIVFAQIEEAVPREDLIKILYWIAIHSDEGDDSAVDQLRPLGLGNGPSDMVETRGRAAVYAVKLLGRITGKRPGR